MRNPVDSNQFKSSMKSGLKFQKAKEKINLEEIFFK